MAEHEVVHGFKVHPAASLFPNLGKRDFKELVQDIKANGLKQPPLFVKENGEEFMLDGRQRTAAWVAAGFKLKDLPKDYYEPETDKPSELTKVVYSLGVARRHMNNAQRVAIRVKLLREMEQEESDEETAKETGAKVPTVKKVKKMSKEKLDKTAAGDTSGRGRPAGGGPPRRVTLDREEQTPKEAAAFLIEKWNDVPRSFLANFIEQLTAQWEAFEPEVDEDDAEESEDAI